MWKNKKLVNVIITGIMAILFLATYLRNRENIIENNFGAVEVLCTSHDVAANAALRESDVTTRKIPIRFVEPKAILVKIPGQAAERLKNKVALSPMAKGTQVTESLLKSATPEDPGIAKLVPPGKRGYILHLSNMEVAQLLLPGDFVDVLATYNVHQGETLTKATQTILQNILVLSVGTTIKSMTENVTTKSEKEDELNLSLALDPMEAQRLTLAQSEAQGELSVVVRANGDNQVFPLPVFTPQNLMH